MTGSLFSIIGIQIMFDEERNQWIATHYQNGEVKVYDSCFSGSLSPSIREMLVCFYQPAVRKNSLVVTVMQIVQQKGSADCGLFAIGTAFQAASEELRQHLKENFDTGILTPCPTTTSGKKNKRKHIVITLYCVCSLPAELTLWWSNVSNVTHDITIGL